MLVYKISFIDRSVFRYLDISDFIASYSSIEHSGLGRYGVPIDPIGDLREMQKVRMYTHAQWAFLLCDTLLIGLYAI
ncbi:hypothetical protein Ddc_12401 [Ditylenchus destructor]|nr:hypothetical protein Ddc_12401 [Ditylenchus destructor]